MKALALASAALLLALALSLHRLAGEYFSVHMAQHIVFVLVIPALVLLGLPELPAIRIRAPLAWAAGIGSMLFWHIPAVFQAAMMHPSLHILEIVTLLAGGTVYWWPILSPARLQPVPEAAAYLITSCMACTAMGIAISFAPAPLYMHTREDQQIGGLLMWVPCCLVYLTATMAMFARWYGEERLAADERR